MLRNVVLLKTIETKTIGGITCYWYVGNCMFAGIVDPYKSNLAHEIFDSGAPFNPLQ